MTSPLNIEWLSLVLDTEKKNELPQVGAMVQVASLGRKATVLKVDTVKMEMVVQAGNMKLKLKFADIRW